MFSARGWLLPQMANLFKDMLLPVFAADYKPAGYELSATPFVPAAALWVLSRAAANAPRTYVMQCFDSALELMGHEDAETDGKAADFVSMLRRHHAGVSHWHGLPPSVRCRW